MSHKPEMPPKLTPYNPIYTSLKCQTKADAIYPSATQAYDAKQKLMRYIPLSHTSLKCKTKADAIYPSATQAYDAKLKLTPYNLCHIS